MKKFTVFDKERIKNKVYKTLVLIGFKYHKEGYYYIQLNSGEALCMGYGLMNDLHGQINENSWMWQTAELNSKPLFGYSGTTSVSECDHDRVIDITLKRIFELGKYMGMSQTELYWKGKISKAQGILSQ